MLRVHGLWRHERLLLSDDAGTRRPPGGGGRVLVLNGASSAGKTTLARGFRDARAAAGELWLLTGIDDYLEKLPQEWFAGEGFAGPYAGDGVRFEPAPGGGLRVVVGSAGARLLAAYRRSVAASARAGLDVIVDEVVIDADAARDWAVALEGLEVRWVAVRCDPDAAEAREASRVGHRAPGLARGLSGTVHRHVRYDAEIDTTSITPDEALDRLSGVVAAW